MYSHLYFSILCALSVWFCSSSCAGWSSVIGLWRIKSHNEGSEQSLEPLCLPSLTMLILFPFPFPPGVTCLPVWSSEQSATAVTRSRRPMLRRANATWSVKERRATCAEEPTDCPSIGWSWARSQRADVSFALCKKKKTSPGLHRSHMVLHTGLSSRHKRARSRLKFESFNLLPLMWATGRPEYTRITDRVHWGTNMLFLIQKCNKPGCSEGKYLFYFGLMPQLGASCSAVFTSFPGELCYLRRPASRGLHPKHAAAGKLKWSEGRADYQKWKRCLCACVEVLNIVARYCGFLFPFVLFAVRFNKSPGHKVR